MPARRTTTWSTRAPPTHFSTAVSSNGKPRAQTPGYRYSASSTEIADDRPLPRRHGLLAAGLGQVLPTRATYSHHVPVAAVDVTDSACPGILLLRSEERRVGKECRSRW